MQMTSSFPVTTMVNTTFRTTRPHHASNVESEDLITSLSPLTIGLFLEFGVVSVVLGNLLVLASLKVQQHWVITDVLLFSLSLADFIDGFLPLQLVIVMNYFLEQDWTLYLCGAFTGVVNCLRFASAGTVTLIALERAFMIVSPFKYHTTLTLSLAKKLIIFTWIISAFFASLPFIGVGKVGYDAGKCFYHLSDLGNTYAILILSVSFLLLTIVLGCYIAVKFSSEQFIRRQTEMYARHHLSGSDLSREINPAKNGKIVQQGHSRPSGVREIRRLSLMMAVVVVLYFVSWLPILITSVVSMVTNRKPKKIVVVLTGMVSLTYALANPVLYGKMSSRYRRAYKEVFRSVFRICGQRPRSSSTNSTSTVHAHTILQVSKELRSKGTITNVKQPFRETEHVHYQHTTAEQKKEKTTGSDITTEEISFRFREENEILPTM